ncbi:alpha/beta hydrolase [Allosalinactinospora lopnorensis]|uniref:alpha/beta hydrolase n=1 Tax=Allosalinactinospora lopnorensis TaxID=1352348 RepID=UPI000B0AA03C|nr:alpha/beta fold hydrolase [Allosalinactinospora lopnorensis]
MSLGSESAGGWSPVLRVALIVLVVLITLIGLMWGLQRQMIYLPDNSPVSPAAERIGEAEDVALRTEDGLELGAWFVPPRGADRETAVLVANGNAGNRESRLPTATAFAGLGFSVLLFDYRGYGGNPGSPSEEGLSQDARAALDALTERYGFPPEQVIYFGESIGTGVATRLAAEHPPAGLVLRSPFTDLASVGQRHYPFLPVRALLRDRYPIAEQIRRVTVPTTVIYGDSDTIIPPKESREVAAAAGKLYEEVVLSGAGHNDPEMFDGAEVVSAVGRLGDEVAP